MDDPGALLRELEASGDASSEEIREAIVRAILRLSAEEREHLAVIAERAGRPDLAMQIRHALAGGLVLKRPQ